MKSRKNKISGHFVALPDYMTNSKAWKDLSCKAVWVYIELKKKDFGYNEENLSLTYNEVKYKMASGTFRGAIKELVKGGFIEIIRPGGLYRRCTIYGLSYKWKLIEGGIPFNPHTPLLKLPQKNTIGWHNIDRSPKIGVESVPNSLEQGQNLALSES